MGYHLASIIFFQRGRNIRQIRPNCLICLNYVKTQLFMLMTVSALQNTVLAVNIGFITFFGKKIVNSVSKTTAFVLFIENNSKWA